MNHEPRIWTHAELMAWGWKMLWNGVLLGFCLGVIALSLLFAGR